MDKKVMTSKWWIALAAAGLVVALVTGVRTARGIAHAKRMPDTADYGSSALSGVLANVSPALQEKRKQEEVRIREACKTAVDAYRTSVKAEFEAFKRRVNERSSAFDVVSAGIPATVDNYGFSKCWDLMCALAKDKLGMGDETNFQELMDGDLRDGFYRPIQDARAEVLALLNEFQTRLETCRRDFEKDLSDIPDWDRSLGEAPASLRAESLRIEKMLGALQEAQIGASVSAAFDAACLAGVCQTVSRLLAGAAGRFAAGAAAGAVASQLDSPAPGPGDLVGLGIFGVGAVATAWQVRAAAKTIPEELRKTMYETVESQRSEVVRRTLDEGEKLFLTYSTLQGMPGVRHPGPLCGFWRSIRRSCSAASRVRKLNPAGTGSWVWSKVATVMVTRVVDWRFSGVCRGSCR